MLSKKKLVAGLLATALAVPSASFSVFADEATGDGNLGGDSTVEDVTFSVVVPSNLDFAIDPFELSATGVVTGSQISGTDYQFLNHTEAPVKIGFEFTVTDESDDDEEDVTLVASTSEVSPDDVEAKDKKVYLAVLGASSITMESGAISDVAYDATATGADMLTAFSADGEATAAFIMDKSPDGEAVAATTTGVAAFTFYGVLNTYAAWQDSDIKISADYKLTALRTTTYATLKDTAVGVNQIKTTPPVIGFTGALLNSANQLSSLPFSISKAGSGDITVPFYLGDATVTKLTSATDTAYAVNTDYTVSGGVITIKAARASGFRGLAVDTAVVTKIVLNNGKTYVLNWKVVA